MTMHPDWYIAFGIPAAVCVAGVLLWLAVEARGVRESIRSLFGGNRNARD